MLRLFLSRTMILALGLMLGVAIHAWMPRFNSRSASNVVGDVRSVASQMSGPATTQDGLSGPKLSLEETVYNFGRAEEGSKVSHAFTIRNTGDSVLEIGQIKPACGCTVAKLDRATLKAGESTQLQVTLDLRNQIGNQNRQILVQSNDKSSRNSMVAIVGESVSHITKTPSTLNLGRLSVDAESTGRVDVRANPGISFHVKGVRTSHQFLLAGLTEIEEAKRFQVTISMLPPIPSGAFRGSVKLITDQKDLPEIVIPVRAQIGTGGPVLIGDQPEVSGPTLGGDAIDLATLRGHPTVVVFWASWCGHCKKELPLLVGLHKEYHGSGLEILGINVDRESPKAQAACDNFGVPWANIHFTGDEQAIGNKNPISTRYQITGIPAIWVIDRDGTVIATDLRGERLQERVKELLAQDSQEVQSAKALSRVLPRNRASTLPDYLQTGS